MLDIKTGRVCCLRALLDTSEFNGLAPTYFPLLTGSASSLVIIIIRF